MIRMSRTTHKNLKAAGPLSIHPTGYSDELQRHRVYSTQRRAVHPFPQNADNSRPSGKVKDSLQRSAPCCPSGSFGGLASPKQFRNFLAWAGFATVFVENSSYFSRAMSRTANTRRLFPLLSRDYMRRRRAVRRIANTLMIAVLSLTAAYFITRPTGGTGFPARKPVAIAEATPDTAPHSPTDASGYELEPGPHKVSDVEDLVLHDAKRDKDR